MTTKKTYQDPHAQREAQRYDNPVPSREVVLEVLKDQGRPLTVKELIKLLKVRDADSREAFGFRIKAMLRDGQLLENRAGRLCLIDEVDLIAGRIEAHREGFGFVLRDDGEPDLFLPPRQMRKVMHNDQVLVSLQFNRRNGRKAAHIIEITQRAMTHLVGRFVREGQTAWLRSENKQLSHEALVTEFGDHYPEDNEFWRAAITQYPDGKHTMRVALEERIASPDEAGMEIEVALRNFDLPFVWPDAVQQQLAPIADTVDPEVARQRIDLCDQPFVTIDGADARDFDDAIRVIKRPRGGWRLMVAIADVSHYVRPDTPLDREGHLRATSVYFPSRVIPMLPEKLSNGLCSLNPDVDRLALCCDMTISAKGRVSGYVFREAVIRSHYRFTYDQVAAFIEQPGSQEGKQLKANLSPELQQQLHDFHAMFHALRAQREQRGAIDFESRDTRMVFDEQLKIKAIVPQERNVAHMMIEEAMLAANTSAARLLHKEKIPALYRNHEAPVPDKLNGLREFIAPLGLQLNWRDKDKVKPAIFQQLGEQLIDRPDRSLVQLVMLRTLTQARYEAENKGHFGLAYPYYTHFTSPIRRYPDLLVHRALRYLIRQDKSKHVDNATQLPLIPKTAILPFSQQQMVELGEHCSMAERRADDASRDVEKWLKCQFMEERLGDEYKGTISGVTNFGLFVELDDLRIDGLVHIATLGNDYFRFDPDMQLLRGEDTGYCFQLGDAVTVQVAAVVTEERKIDLSILSHQPAKRRGRYRGKTARKKSAKAKRGKAKSRKKTARKGPPRGRKAKRRKGS